ncbi:hypothetical protein BLA29_014621, partial [Euroglyphus maynei]
MGFRVALVPNSALWTSYQAMAAIERRSFIKIKELLRKARRPLRDSRVKKFYNLTRKPGQTIDEMAIEIQKLVDELYTTVPKDIKDLMVRDRFYASLGPDL